MIYYNRKTSLKIGNLEIPEELTLDWEYEHKPDSVTASLVLNLTNLSKATKESIKKGDIVEFEFGYENGTTPFFYGIVDNLPGGETRGVTKVLTIKCMEYTNTIKKKVSRSYNPGTLASYIIKDLATLCTLEVEFLELGVDISYNGGYNIYDLPLIALKKICKSCGSDLSIQGNKLNISSGTKGYTRGVSFDFSSGLLAPIDYIQSSLLDDSEYGKQKKREDITKVKSTNKATTLANPDVKKNSIIEVLGELYKVTGFTIRNWKFEGELLKIG